MRLMVTDIAANSPAALAALRPNDQIVSVDGAPATAAVLNDALKAGARIRLHISRGGVEQDLDVDVAKNMKKTYTLAPEANSSPSQAAILRDWLRNGQ